jgi:hypothetical protein
MKDLLTTLTLSVCVLFYSFTVKIGIEEVITAMQSGNAAQIAKFFDSSVEITMSDKSNSYSKSQAEMILKDFFATNIVKSFEENAGSEYCIGRLTTKGGVFRTTIYMKQKGDQQVVQELRFENH